MRLLTILSSTHWLCTMEIVPPIMEKTVSLGRYIIWPKDSYENLGFNLPHHWTCSWQSQRNLVGTAPSRVLHRSPASLGPNPNRWSVPSHSPCRDSIPVISKLHQVWEPMLLWEKYGLNFLPKHNGNWLERQEMQIYTYLWKTVHLPSETASFPKSHACTKLNSHNCHAVFHEAVTFLCPPSQKGKRKNIFSVHLTWAWKQLSAVIELRWSNVVHKLILPISKKLI